MTLIDDVAFAEEDDLIEEAVDIRRRLSTKNEFEAHENYKYIAPVARRLSLSIQDSDLAL